MNNIGITFGIITDGTYDSRIQSIIDSIQKNNIPLDLYEIIIVGNSKIKRQNTIIIEFDQSVKPGWITRKKNIITQNSKFEIITFSTDYVCYNDNWYQQICKFNENNQWDILITKINNLDKKTRLWDWIAYTNKLPLLNYSDQKLIRGYFNSLYQTGNFLLDYNDLSNPFLYISGLFWIAKKHVMQSCPLDQQYYWALAGSDDIRKTIIKNNLCYNYCNEDLQWSYRVLKINKYIFKHVPTTFVYTLKQKPQITRQWRY